MPPFISIGHPSKLIRMWTLLRNIASEYDLNAKQIHVVDVHPYVANQTDMKRAISRGHSRPRGRALPTDDARTGLSK